MNGLPRASYLTVLLYFTKNRVWLTWLNDGLAQTMGTSESKRQRPTQQGKEVRKFCDLSSVEELDHIMSWSTESPAECTRDETQSVIQHVYGS